MRRRRRRRPTHIRRTKRRRQLFVIGAVCAFMIVALGWAAWEKRPVKVRAVRTTIRSRSIHARRVHKTPPLHRPFPPIPSPLPAYERASHYYLKARYALDEVSGLREGDERVLDEAALWLEDSRSMLSQAARDLDDPSSLKTAYAMVTRQEDRISFLRAVAAFARARALYRRAARGTADFQRSLRAVAGHLRTAKEHLNAIRQRRGSEDDFVQLDRQVTQMIHDVQRQLGF